MARSALGGQLSLERGGRYVMMDSFAPKPVNAVQNVFTRNISVDPVANIVSKSTRPVDLPGSFNDDA